MARFTKEQRAAINLFRGFRETDPQRLKKIDFEMPTAVAAVGRCDSIEYRTTHNGKSVLYRHEFAPGSKPILCAGPEEGQLYLLGGRFHFTDRGIVDLDARGREIEDDSERYDDQGA